MNDWSSGEYAYRDELIFEIQQIWSHFGAQSSMEDYYDLPSMSIEELEATLVGAANWHHDEMNARVNGRRDRQPSPETPPTYSSPLPLAAFPANIQRAILLRAASRVLHPFYRRRA